MNEPVDIRKHCEWGGLAGPVSVKKEQPEYTKVQWRFMRRSGVAVCMMCYYMDDWRPDYIIQAGVGVLHKEVEVLTAVWPKAKLIGYEANPDSYKSIKDIYPGELYNVALDNKLGSTKLYHRNRHKDGSSFYEHTDGDDVELEVRCRKLDSHVPCLQGNILLWLDCEGAELRVLEGGEEFIAGVDVVNAEMSEKPNVKGCCTPSQVHGWLVAHGFIRQHVHTHRTAAGQYDAIYCRQHLFKPERCCDPEQFRNTNHGISYSLDEKKRYA